jgi:hypothetical protein
MMNFFSLAAMLAVGIFISFVCLDYTKQKAPWIGGLML